MTILNLLQFSDTCDAIETNIGNILTEFHSYLILPPIRYSSEDDYWVGFD